MSKLNVIFSLSWISHPLEISVCSSTQLVQEVILQENRSRSTMGGELESAIINSIVNASDSLVACGDLSVRAASVSGHR